MFTDIFVLHISRPNKMIKSWSFLQKMRHEKLYKNCIKQFCWLAMVTFPLLNMNNLHSTTTSQQNKNVRKTFLFCDYRACVELSKAHLSKKKLRFYHFFKSRYSQNKKVLQIFVFCWELVVPYRLLILSNKKATIASQQNWFMQFL